MLTIIIRSCIVFILLVFGIRLMGKRTIGELQPYEFVITLAVADLACTPMQDISVPLLYGIVPIFVLFIIHYLVTIITMKSQNFRKFINGKPFIVIDSDGINSECLTKLNLSVNDLLSLIRQQGYFSIPEISFGIIETNGKLSIMKNDTASPPSSVPVTLMTEGAIMEDNLTLANLSKEQVTSFLAKHNLSQKQVLLFTKDEDTLFIQPKNKKYLVMTESL